MINKRFTASLAAAAVLGAFGPAFGQTSTDVSPGVNVGSGNQSVQSGAAANRSSTDRNSSSTVDRDASSTSASGATTPDEERGEQQGRGHAFGRDRDDKQTGLDRADQAAGEHGRQGRDNARMHQGDRD